VVHHLDGGAFRIGELPAFASYAGRPLCITAGADMNRIFQGGARAGIAPTRNLLGHSVADLHSGYAPGPDRTAISGFDRTDLGGAFPRSLDGSAKSRFESADLLREQDFVLGLPAKGKRSALARIAARLGENAGMSPGAVLAAMLRRERLGSTAIGNGVAIPHARLEEIREPKAMLATLQRPVWFDAQDEEPVDLLLAVLWPKADRAGFLQALARLCRLLRHAELRDGIRAAETPTEAMAWVEAFQERTTAIPCRTH
jgi:PTS system nitrogen regulatory IIA component